MRIYKGALALVLAFAASAETINFNRDYAFPNYGGPGSLPPPPTLSFPGFDPNLGTLTGVSFSATVNIANTRIEVSPSGPITVVSGNYVPHFDFYYPDTSGSFTPATPLLLTLQPTLPYSFTTPTATTTFTFPGPASANGTLAAAPTLFVSSGDVPIPLRFPNFFDVSGPFFLRSIVLDAQVNLNVTYTYDIPEPGSVFVVSAGLLVFAWRRRASISRI